jgi:hypothetical protein
MATSAMSINFEVVTLEIQLLNWFQIIERVYTVVTYTDWKEIRTQALSIVIPC